jgi:histidinol-phosphate aminotransferase
MEKTMNIPKAYATTVTKQAIDMTLSINPLGCSPRAQEALRALTLKDLSTYPNQQPLLAALATFFRIPATSIVLGSGSEQLIKLICQTFVRSNSTVLVEEGSFFLFTSEPLLQNATVTYTSIPPKEIQAIRPSVLFIANPTTPGGINRTNKELLAVIKRLKPRVVVVDEANGEFRKETMISELKKVNNLIVLRTFSKALGIAGLRIGFAISNPRVSAKLAQFQQPFPVTTPAIVAAEAALSDRDFLNRTLLFVSKERKFLTNALETRGFRVSASITNNLFVSSIQNTTIINKLQKLGVGVIDGAFFPNNPQQGFRISIKDRKTNRAFLARLDEVLACLPTAKLLGSKEEL